MKCKFNNPYKPVLEIHCGQHGVLKLASVWYCPASNGKLLKVELPSKSQAAIKKLT